MKEMTDAIKYIALKRGDVKREHIVFETEMASFVPDKKSYDAKAFYEKHVDNIHFINYDEEHPDFNFNDARHFSCTNIQSKQWQKNWCPNYSPKRFENFVAAYFMVDVKQMEQHWRDFK